jgi:hypothetical protein
MKMRFYFQKINQRSNQRNSNKFKKNKVFNQRLINSLINRYKKLKIVHQVKELINHQ